MTTTLHCNIRKLKNINSIKNTFYNLPSLGHIHTISPWLHYSVSFSSIKYSIQLSFQKCKYIFFMNSLHDTRIIVVRSNVANERLNNTQPIAYIVPPRLAKCKFKWISNKNLLVDANKM